MRLTHAGFRAIASTGFGAAWAAGKQDGELGLDAVLDHLRMLVAATPLPVHPLPVTADFENEFADRPEDVAQNVSLAVRKGGAALSIEDRSGSRMYGTEMALEHLQDARRAIGAIDPTVMLVGRTLPAIKLSS